MDEIKDIIDSGVRSKAYDDVLHPSAREIGKTIAIIPRAINVALQPVEKWLTNKEQNFEQTKCLLNDKLENVEEDKIVEPESYVAVPAINSLSYSMCSDELRNLYANLLAKAMYKDTKDYVHPAFVEVIKQMSPNDAILFKKIFNAYNRPLINLYLKKKNGRNYITNHISWIEDISYNNTCISMDNLCRLKLIDIPFDSYYVENTIYNPVRETSSYKRIKEEIEMKIVDSKFEKVDEEKKIIEITDLGKLFYNICVSDDFNIDKDV